MRDTKKQNKKLKIKTNLIYTEDLKNGKGYI